MNRHGERQRWGSGHGRTFRTARSASSDGPPFSVDLVGPYSSRRLTQSWRGTGRRSTPQLEALIARTWQTQLALARKTDRILFDGELACLVGLQATPDALHLELGPTCFRDFLGTNLHNTAAALNVGADCLANPLGISSTVITRDGLLALGRRASWVAFHAGFLHTFGGLLESADRREDGSYDVFGAAVRELAEELHLRREEIAGMVVIGLVRDLCIYQPELLFDVTITLTREELTARFDPAAKRQEHTVIEFVRDEPSAIVPFLTRTAPVAPVAQAALLLHGRNRWGDEWYERACRSRFGDIPSSTGDPGRASAVLGPPDEQ